MALSAHLLEQADTYGPARTPCKSLSLPKKKTILKVQQDQNVQVKCCQERVCKYTSSLSLTVLKGMNAFAQRVR